ncbi:MAG: hypothetical protein LAT84_12500 [Balneolia bacterium]|nr:hypothetical protein [Balneolia bacterium]
MNKLLLFASAALFLLFATLPETAEAQRRGGPQTLFASNVHTGGFGQLNYGLTSLNGEIVPLRGYRGALSFEIRRYHNLNLGFGVYRANSDFDAVDWNLPEAAPTLRTDYSGFEVEYLYDARQLIHFGVQGTFGTGKVRYRDNSELFSNTSSDYFVIQPGANIHLNVTTWFRMSAGIFYRFAIDSDLPGTSDADLSGFSALLGLRFGWF